MNSLKRAFMIALSILMIVSAASGAFLINGSSVRAEGEEGETSGDRDYPGVYLDKTAELQ